MTDDVLDKVRKAIALTGYPLELEAASIAEQHGWIPFHSVQFPDPETKKLRELDLLIYKNINNRRLELRISCKGSFKNQFVFFTRERHSPQGADELKFTPVINDIERLRAIPGFLSELRYFSYPQEAVNYTVLTGPNIDREGRSLLREAIMSTVTSIHYRLLPRNLLFDQRGTIYFFVVLIHGAMFEARFDHSSKSMIVEETDYAQWCGKYSIPESYRGLSIDDVNGGKVPLSKALYWFGDWIRVEFIKDTYLPDYLDNLEKSFKQLDKKAISTFGKSWSPSNFPKIVKPWPDLKPAISKKRNQIRRRKSK